jgi:hypothetical protein
MIIIGRISFWIHKPFEKSITEALDQFKDDYMEKVKTHITSKSMPSKEDDLLAFLYNLIIYI